MTRLSQEEYDEIIARRGAKPSSPAKPKKRSKYGAKKTWIDGICFDSALESKFYLKLKKLLASKQIAGFARQCRFVLTEGTDKDNRAIEYVADWIVLYLNGTFEIIDNKGYENEVFKQKFKMFKHKYPELELKIEK